MHKCDETFLIHTAYLQMATANKESMDEESDKIDGIQHDVYVQYTQRVLRARRGARVAVVHANGRGLISVR